VSDSNRAACATPRTYGLAQRLADCFGAIEGFLSKGAVGFADEARSNLAEYGGELDLHGCLRVSAETGTVAAGTPAPTHPG
jgi:hypothetical protein